jgi:hypothetical protein
MKRITLLAVLFVITSLAFAQNFKSSAISSNINRMRRPISLSPMSLSFGSQPINTTSAALSVNLPNNSNDTLTLTSISASGNFAETNDCGSSLDPGDNCTISVTFTPTATGSQSGTLSVVDSAGTQTVALYGKGASGAAAAALSPSSLTFSSRTINTTSAAQTVTLTNSGSAALSVTGISASGSFAETNTCGSSVAAGANCTISVTFTPTATGALSGTLSVVDSVGTQTVALSGTGTGVAAATLSVSSLTFSSQLVNTTSTAMSVTLTNSGSAALSVTGISASGTFAETNNCGTSLAAGANCNIEVTFTPTTAGTLSGTLSVVDSVGTQTVALSGAGATAGTLVTSPANIAFGNVTTGQSSSQTVTLSNSGGTPVTISSLSLSGSGVTVTGLTTPLTLGASGYTSFTVTFDPTSAGSVSGGVYLTNNGSTPSFELPVTGTGVAVASISLSPTSLSFANQGVGTTSAAQSVTLTNNGSATLTLSSISASGSFAETNNCGSTVAAGGSCTIEVTLTPTAQGATSGTLAVADNATGSPQSVTLAGTGVPEVLLSWNADSGSLNGYNTYRSTVSGGPYTKLTSSPQAPSSYTDLAVQSGNTYYYVVTAVSTSNVESGYSDQAVATVP